jgi:hypothetical protein
LFLWSINNRHGPVWFQSGARPLVTLARVLAAMGLHLWLAVHELAMNLSPKRVHDGNLKILIVPQTAVAEVLRKLFAVLDSFRVSFQVDSDPVSERNAIDHIEEKFLHSRQP